jgi:hypothetical protein
MDKNSYTIIGILIIMVVGIVGYYIYSANQGQRYVDDSANINKCYLQFYSTNCMVGNEGCDTVMMEDICGCIDGKWIISTMPYFSKCKVGLKSYTWGEICNILENPKWCQIM